MIRPEYFIDTLSKNGISFYAGVPDSLLKNICAYITDNIPEKDNIIAANEGGAMGLAAGYHLATGKIPVVYMQNSGEGNIINPMMSLTDKEVYNIPVLLVIGWRGEPGKHDEPQHVKQGKVTLSLLDAMGIKYCILSEYESEVSLQIAEAVKYMKETSEACALIVRKGIFDEYKLLKNESSGLTMPRETAIDIVAGNIEPDAVIVSTTGMISRELFEFRAGKEEGHERDFLTVGSMGHASQIALGIAIQQPQRRVFCFDGDGASIMHMGNMAIVGSMHPSNYVHVIFNNGAHDSVGGQPTVGLHINIPQIASAVGYRHVLSVDNEEGLKEALVKIRDLKGPVLLEVKVKKGARKDLGRPTTTPIQNKEAFMATLLNS